MRLFERTLAPGNVESRRRWLWDARWALLRERALYQRRQARIALPKLLTLNGAGRPGLWKGSCVSCSSPNGTVCMDYFELLWLDQELGISVAL